MVFESLCFFFFTPRGLFVVYFLLNLVMISRAVCFVLTFQIALFCVTKRGSFMSFRVKLVGF